MPASMLRVFRNYHFWAILAMFILIAMLHYPQELLLRDLPNPTSTLGLTRHSIERVLLLIPVTYASFIFGLRGGIIGLTIAYLIMLPRALFDSPAPRDALFESIGIIAVGSLVNLWFYMYRRTIAERKKAEAALRESEKNFRDFFESALDAIWIHDLDGRITAANEAVSRLVGYSMDELQGAHVSLFLTPEGMNLAREVKLRLLQHQPVVPYEQRFIKKDGTEAICMVATNLIIGGGEPMAFQNIATDVTEEKRLYDNLRFYLKEITRAQEEERKRIARELHDSTAQTLIALLHKIENFLNEKSRLPEGETKTIWGFHEQIRDVLQEVRRFSRDLRPSILDDLGLLPALEWLTGELKHEYGIDAGLKVTGTQKRLSPEAELILFRIVQEALRNTTRHARASRAEVIVEFVDSKIKVSISDNGVGFKIPVNLGTLTQTGKLGLTGMQERAQLLGGSLKLDSEMGRGTVITVEAPI